MKSKLFKERKEIFSQISDIVNNFKKSLKILFVIQFLFLIGAMVSPYLYGLLIDDVMIKKDIDILKWICIGYFGIYCLDSLLIVIQRKIQVKTFNDLKLEVRNMIWRQYMKAPFRFHEKYGNGDLKQRMDTDVDTVESFINEQLINFTYNLISTPIYLVVIILISWKLALFSLLMVPVAFWITKQMAKGSREAWGRYRNDYGEYESWLQGSLKNWKEIKVLNIQENQIEKFGSEWSKLKVNFYKGCLYFFVNRSFIGFSDFFITKMNLYFVGGLLIFNGDLKIGMLFVFIKFYEKFFAGITDLTKANMRIAEYTPSLNRVIEISNMNFDDIQEKKKEIQSPIIEFRNVSFHYKSSKNNVLNNINFKIEENKCVAIVGRSGNGKTTILKLLLGLYEDYSGNIYLGNEDIKNISSNSLHSYISVVMQDSILFNASIIDNMRMMMSDATVEEIMEACKKAFIHNDIMNMPDEYHTIIGERGVQLSGGQKQRIAIARALLVKPKVIIFDEATSALDSESEKVINNTIEALKTKCTIILIAHRMSSIVLSDLVVVIENSKIVETGNYTKLIEESVVFNQLFKGQYNILAK